MKCHSKSKNILPAAAQLLLQLMLFFFLVMEEGGGEMISRLVYVSCDPLSVPSVAPATPSMGWPQ